jgi:hypothetical protein
MHSKDKFMIFDHVLSSSCSLTLRRLSSKVLTILASLHNLMMKSHFVFQPRPHHNPRLPLALTSIHSAFPLSNETLFINGFYFVFSTRLVNDSVWIIPSSLSSFASPKTRSCSFENLFNHPQNHPIVAVQFL